MNEFKDLFPRGGANTAYAQYFVGNSYLNMLTTQGVVIGNVTFEPACRNNWHIHHAKSGGGQILLCTAGRGWYQEWGKAAQELTPGTVVVIPAGVKHWHGAAKDSWFSHLAVEVSGEETRNEWCEPVSDEDYDSITKKPNVYFTKEITPDSLVRIYEALKVEQKDKVAVKISTGEPGGHNYLHPELIGKLVKKLNGTIVECCTAYEGKRLDPAEHWKAVEDHGFKTIAEVDIMDEFAEMEIPIEGGYHLDKDIVGKHLENYGSVLVLSHFKGHAMGGFGGALKNISIGIASTKGKTNIHTAGKTTDYTKLFDNLPEQDVFLESMADACKGVINYVGKENMAYVSIANRLSVDCDCDSHPAEPEMDDIGIFASLDPVAIDQACYDAVKNSKDIGKHALIERMDSRHGIRTVEAAAEHGLGSREYNLISLDEK